MKRKIQWVVVLWLAVSIFATAGGYAFGEEREGASAEGVLDVLINTGAELDGNVPEASEAMVNEPVVKEYYQPLDLNDTKVTAAMKSVRQTGSQVELLISFGYGNAKDPMESACFSDKFSVAVFQKNIACPQLYIEGYYSKANPSTLIRNGASIEFSMCFALEDENVPYEIVFMPQNARNTSEYISIPSPSL